MKTELEKIQEEYKALGDRIEALKNGLKFEVGKWYKYTNSNIHLVCFTDLKQHGYGICNIGWVNNDCWSKENLRLATPSEVEQHLIAEAKKRGFKEGVTFKCLISGKSGVMSEDHILFNGAFSKYDGLESSFKNSISNGVLYKDGKWAEIVKDQPILIGGKYEVEFHSTYVTVNACAYTKTDLQQIYHVLKMEQVRSLNLGCQGQIKVTPEEINLILERLK